VKFATLQKPNRGPPRFALKPRQMPSPTGLSALSHPVVQAKLRIGAAKDHFEQEADRVAERVTRMPDPNLQRACSCGGSCPKCRTEQPDRDHRILQRKRFQAIDSGEMAALPLVHEVLRSPGQPLDPVARAFMEPRFGHDFGPVRVHSGVAAEQSARDMNAQAYTVGRDIVFGRDRFAPGTNEGRRLLAHELAHVVQQSGPAWIHPGQSQGEGLCAPANDVDNTVRRFADVDHHIIEEAALKKVFTPEQLEAIEEGNTHRDYSQLPAVANALLLGQSTQFGGYKQHEHFDNFVFDRANDRWVSQDEFEKIWDDHAGQWVERTIPLAAKPGKPRTTPPQYIEAQLLAAVQNDMPDSTAFEHLGNAFHTIEDFFAHSNFVELAQGDTTHGTELATHSTHVPGPGSEDSILGSVSDPASAAFFKNRFSREQATASPLSHGALAKDFHENPNHALAITLAALVIRQVGLMLKEAFALKTRELREEFVRQTVVATLARYFRPPSETDKWWETLQAEDRGVMRRKIQALQDQTPVTVNQTPASPLRNIEATRFSAMKAIGLGTSLSFPLGEGKFLTIGHMLYLPGTGSTPLETGLILPPYVSNQDEKVRLVSGFQFTGTFDESKWFK
jgi:Domain of unknown function (DUF4157)/Heterokaryon incompatibility protein Het-C